MAGARQERVLPDAELREVYNDLHRRHLALYDALRPLFNGESAGADSLASSLRGTRGASA
jgi:hypothetical protein